jgi:hypothetical protein
MAARRGPRLALLLPIAVAACSGTPPPSATPAPPVAPATGAATTTTAVPDEAGRAVDVYTPVVGDCFDRRTRTDEQNRETAYHLLVDCALPHGHEVFALITVEPAAAPHPGTEALRRFARLECPRRFGDYVGQRYELSRYGLGYELPTPEQWADWPAVGCTLTAPGDGRTSGSGRATKQ